jgi:hypothetical protein
VVGREGFLVGMEHVTRLSAKLARLVKEISFFYRHPQIVIDDIVEIAYVCHC